MHGEPLPQPETFKPDSAPTPEEQTAAAVQSGTTTSNAPSFAQPQPTFQDPSKHQTIRIDLAALGMDESKKTEPKRMISFFCKNCSQEIEAPTNLAGSPSECPACGVTFEVPFFSDQGTLHGSDLEPTDQALKEIKGRTIRIEVPDDI